MPVLLLAACTRGSLTVPPDNSPADHTCEPLGLADTGAEFYALAEYNGELVVGGAFCDVAGSPQSSLVRIGPTGWQLLGPQPNSNVCALAVRGGRLIAGSTFTRAGSDSAGYIAAGAVRSGTTTAAAWTGTCSRSVPTTTTSSPATCRLTSSRAGTARAGIR